MGNSSARLVGLEKAFVGVDESCDELRRGGIRAQPELWQIRQVVKVANKCQVDWCCCFGSRGSPDIWTSFIALVLWIAIHIKLIELLLAFMDDHFSFDSTRDLLYYPPFIVDVINSILNATDAVPNAKYQPGKININ